VKKNIAGRSVTYNTVLLVLSVGLFTSDIIQKSQKSYRLVEWWNVKWFWWIW